MKLLFTFILVFFVSCSANEKPENGGEVTVVKRQFFKMPELVEVEIPLGEATTTLLDNSANRVSNILLACEKNFGKRILPDEEFSFNDTTGERSVENGYKPAPVIINGKSGYDSGGGVCQVSTTIYQAALNAGLEITEQHNHSKPVAYAYAGKDATVAFGFKDLKFKNNTKDTIYIYTWVEERTVYSKIIKKEFKKSDSGFY